MAKRTLDLVFPAGGLDEKAAYQRQAPFTTARASNVRSTESIEGRERGGSRPGLSKAFGERLGMTEEADTGGDIVAMVFSSSTTTLDMDEGGNALPAKSSTYDQYIRFPSGALYKWSSRTDANTVVVEGDCTSESVILTGTVDGQGSYGAPSTTITVDAADMVASMVGDSFRFSTSGNYYPITAVNDAGNTFTVTGNASSETDSDAFSIVSDITYECYIASGSPIRSLGEVRPVYAMGDLSGADIAVDPILINMDEYGSGTAISAADEWTDVGTANTYAVTMVDRNAETRNVAAGYSGGDSSVLYTNITNFSTDEDHTVAIGMILYDNSGPGYTTPGNSIFCLVNGSDPDTDGVEVHFKTPTWPTTDVEVDFYEDGVRDTNGPWTGSWDDTIDSEAKLVVSPTGVANEFVVSAYAGGSLVHSKTYDGKTGTRTGFRCWDKSGYGATPGVTYFELNYYAATYAPNEDVLSLPPKTVAVSSGRLYHEDSLGIMRLVDSGPPLNSSSAIHVTDFGSDLYLADFSNIKVDGTVGAITLDAEDPAGYYQLADANVTDWTALNITPGIDMCTVWNVTGDCEVGTYAIEEVFDDYIKISGTGIDTGDPVYYRVQMAPKIFSSSALTVSNWVADDNDGDTATKGIVPMGCPLIARFNGRIFLGGAQEAPHVWYCCRQNDTMDWDYSQDDAAAAVAGSSTFAGVIGSPLTALIPQKDDYLIMGCAHEMWVLRGDPIGGVIINLSQSVGIIHRSAWCITPSGTLIFLSRAGLYALPPGGGSQPVSLSNEKLPRRLLDINLGAYAVTLEYDVTHRGVHIFVSATSGRESTGGPEAYFFNIETGAYWETVFGNDDLDPFAANIQSGKSNGTSPTLLGCRDGYIRKWSTGATDDDGTNMATEVWYGPFQIGGLGGDGMVAELSATLDDTSEDVTWTVYTGDTCEEAMAGSGRSATGTFTAGLNRLFHPRVRGHAAYVVLSHASNAPWAIEGLRMTTRQTGKQRLADAP